MSNHRTEVTRQVITYHVNKKAEECESISDVSVTAHFFVFDRIVETEVNILKRGNEFILCPVE